MKILHLNEHLDYSGGIETYLLSLIPLLRKRDICSVVAYASGRGELVEHAAKVPSLKSTGRSADREGYAAISSLIAAEKPDVIHVHNIHNVGALSAALDLTPTVLTAHDYRYICPNSNLFYARTQQICQRTCGLGCFTTTLRHHCLTPRPGFALKYYRRVRWAMANAKRFGHVIAPSGYVAERFERSGFDRERITVSPYFCPIDPLQEPLAAPTNPTMLFIGRFRELKGYETFIRALGQLPKNVNGLMVGDYSEIDRAMVQRIATESGCVDRLQLEGWASRDAIRNVYARATVMVFPSLWAETLGIVGLEALACGVPVVASDVGGVREWLHDQATGLLVQPNDPAFLAKAVGSIVNSPSMRDAMGRRGIQLIRDKFSAEKHCDRLTGLYRQSRESVKASR
jgi:glycosyltransferase involved in cell wall biosynthesis